MSANITVGFLDNRNSSRVTRPPGGYSNIFSTKETPKTESKSEVIINGAETTEIKVHKTMETQKETVTSTATKTEEVVQQNSDTTEENNQIAIREPEHDKEVQPVNESVSSTTTENSCEIIHSEERKAAEGLPDVAKLDIKTEVIKTETKTVNKIIHKDTLGKIIDETDLPVVEKKVGKSTTRVPPGGFSSGLW